MVVTMQRSELSQARRRAVYRCAAVSLAMLGAAASSQAQPSDTTRNPFARAPEAIAAGARTYEQACQVCHAPRGIGDRGPALNTGRFSRGDSDADLFHTIRAGLAGTQMPAFSRLTDDETWQVVSYVRSLAPAPGTPAPARVSVRTRDGRELRGIRLNEDTFSLQLADDSGAWHFIDKLTNEAVRVDPTTVTPARLERASAEPQNWLMYWGDYQSTHYSGLSQVNASNVHTLGTAWTYPMPGDAVLEATPLVADGVMFTTQPGVVVALDARTGCTWWTANVGAEVRTAIGVATVGQRSIVFFGDSAGQVHALDSGSGAKVWTIRADEHPSARISGAPVFHKGRLYVPVASSEEAAAMQPGYRCCTFRGSVLALDAATGRTLWKRYTIAEPPVKTSTTKRGATTVGPSGAAVWSSPTIDVRRNALYVTTGDNYSDPVTETSDAVLALDLDSGKLLWSRQFTKGDAMNLSCWQPGKENCPDADGPDFDFGAPGMLVSFGQGRRALILGQKSGMAYAVDPDRKGALLWERRAAEGGVAGGIQWGMAADARRAYIAVSDMGIKPPEKRVPGGPRYEIDPGKGGGLLAVNLTDGKPVWRASAPRCDQRRPCSPAQIAPVTAAANAVFSAAIDGFVRAYSPVDGRVLWAFDTARDFQTVNGVPGRGGSIDVAGVVVADGMVFVMSGYNFLGGMPGNVLLAFSVTE